MLQTIRHGINGIVTWVIVVLIILAFTLWGANGFIFSGSNEALAAKINGHKVPKSLIERIYHDQLSQLNRENQNIDIDPQTIRREIRDSVVKQYAYLMQLKKKGFVVSEQELKRAILTNPQFQEDGEFSEKKYKQILANSGLDNINYQTRLRESLLEKQPANGVISSGFVLEGERKYLQGLLNQARSFGYAKISIDTYLDKVSVSDDDAVEYFNSNRNKFNTEEKVSLDYILLDTSSVKKSIKPSLQELQDYYQANIADYTSPKMLRLKHILISAPEGSSEDKSGESLAKAEDILAKIELKEATFESLAEKHSDDPVSKTVSGDLGWIKPGETNPIFEKAAFSLNKKGDISKVIKTPFGYHLIKLSDIRASKTRDFDDIKEELINRYKSDMAEMQISDMQDELANLSFENKHDGLEVVAAELGVELQTLTLASKSKVEKIFNSNIANLAFSSEYLETRYNSDPMKVNNGQTVVIKVKGFVKSKPQEFVEVKTEVVKYLKLQKALNLASKIGDELVEKFNNNSNPFEYIADKKLNWQKAKNVTRGETKISQDVSSLAFSISNFAKHKAKAETSEDKTSVIVVLLENVSSKDTEMSSYFDQVLEQNVAANEFYPYQKSIVDSASIQYYDV